MLKKQKDMTTLKTNKMITIKITAEIKKEIKTSILSFNNQISKEMNFSEDLRKNDKIQLWSNKVKELTQSLENGYI